MLNAECGMRNGEAQAAPAGRGAGVDGKMKPILFSTPMVQAILAGRKTMTRRVIKFPGDYLVHRYDGPEDNGMHLFAWGHVLPTLHVQVMGEKQMDGVTFCDGYYEVKAPHRTGDVLWVRETWGDYGGGTGYYVYRADYPHDAKGYWYEKEHINWCDLPDWRSPVAMPREAARLFLRVTDVRVERVQDITEKDAIREGIMYTDYGMNSDMGKLSVDGGKTFHELKPRHYPGYHAGGATNPDQCFYTARRAFADLWDSINAKRGYGWDTKTWVWVIEFERSEGA